MNTKQVIVIRKDLKMRLGKSVAQGAHASMKAILDRGGMEADQDEQEFFVIPLNIEIQSWLMGLFTKICVSVDSEEELLTLYDRAKEADILCSLIQDCGLTEFNNIPTYTSVAIGPAESEKIDKITGHLKLL